MQKKIWLVYDKFEAERNERYINFYFEEAKKRNVSMELVTAEDGVDFSRLPNAAIMRYVSPDLSEKLEKSGVKVYNNSFLSRIANDKWKTFEYMSENGIKTPETFLVTEDFTPPFYPIVLKPVSGKGGRDVEMINSLSEYEKYAARMKEKCIAQRPVSDLGRDLRVYVVGNRIIASMLRKSKTGFLSNFCLGGDAEIYNLSEEERLQAEKIISLFDIGYAGVDFIFDNGKIIFNEIEDVVGARMLYIYTSVNPVAEYLDYILSDLT